MNPLAALALLFYQGRVPASSEAASVTWES